MVRVFCVVLCLSTASTQVAAQGISESVRRAVATSEAFVDQQNQGQGQGQSQRRNRLLIPGLVSIAAGGALFILGNSVLKKEPADFDLCTQFVGNCDDYKIKNTTAMGVGVAAMGLGASLIVIGAINKNVTSAVVPLRHGLLVRHQIEVR